jgi:phosphonate transport system permease protein
MITLLTKDQEREVKPLLVSYSRSVVNRRLKILTFAFVMSVCIVMALWWSGFDLGLLWRRLSLFTDYFSRLFTLDDGHPVWNDFAEWFWGWKKWLRTILETLLIAYVGTILGAMGGFLCSFTAASNLSPVYIRFPVRRFLEICRTVPEIVFALIFVISFGLGPMAGVLALTIHTLGSLGKLFTEINENIQMNAVEGLKSTGASHVETIYYAVLPQVISNFLSYTILRFEINFRGASVMGFVGAGGIGYELITSVRRFYYSDISAILFMIICTVFLIDFIADILLTRINHNGRLK